MSRVRNVPGPSLSAARSRSSASLLVHPEATGNGGVGPASRCADKKEGSPAIPLLPPAVPKAEFPSSLPTKFQGALLCFERLGHLTHRGLSFLTDKQRERDSPIYRCGSAELLTHRCGKADRLTHHARTPTRGAPPPPRLALILASRKGSAEAPQISKMITEFHKTYNRASYSTENMKMNAIDEKRYLEGGERSFDFAQTPWSPTFHGDRRS